MYYRGGDLNNDISNYKTKLKNIRSSQENKYKITDEAVLDESFVVVLCELFHSYIGAILLDSKSVKTTFEILDKIMLEYLKNNATRDTYTEHPKVTILEEFNRKRQYFKRIRENGGNRIMMKFGQKKEEKFRKQKLYDYQLIIDKFVIYEEAIAYNRSTIKIAQEKAKNVFLEICKELERREKLRLHLSKFDLQNILNYLGIKYKKLN